MAINWSDPKSKVTLNFTVKDACWLPSWGKLHTPSIKEQANLLQMCQLLEKIRGFLGNKEIVVHCMIRPPEYNKQIGGRPQSAHLEGLACDFSVKGMDCDDVRKLLLPKLESWKCRMEDLPDSNWVHVDLKAVITKRFFKP